MVEWLSGSRVQGSSTTPASTSGWKEIGRATVSSGDALDTGVMSVTKENMMILCHTVGSGTTHPKLHFNNETTGTNYAFSYGSGGAADGTPSTEQNYFRVQGGVSGDPVQWSVSNVMNIENIEKLISHYLVINQTDGDTNTVSYEETGGKWASNSIVNRVDCDNGQSGSYSTGTELVVLGVDNQESSTTTPFWQRLDSSDPLSSAGDTLDTGTFTAKKYLMVEYKTIASSNTDDIYIRFNGNSSNYQYVRAGMGVDSSPYNSQDKMIVSWNNSTSDRDGVMMISNFSGEEKIVQSRSSITYTSGVSAAPISWNVYGKWCNTSQINRITLDNQGGGNFDTGSYIRVFGAD